MSAWPCRLIPLLVASLLLGDTAGLQAQERALTRLQVRVWGERDGLPVTSIARVRQTPDGYLWVGTESGLVRFDGASFTDMSTPGSPLYGSAHVTALGVGPEGALWVGTTTGLIRRDGGGTARWEGEPGLLGTAYVEDVHTDAGGRIWVATTGDGLFVIEGRDRAREVTDRGAGFQSVRDLARSATGGLWAATDHGLARVEGDTVLTHVAGGQGSRDARAVLEDRAGRVWLGTREGLFRLDGTRLVPAAESGPLRGTLIRALREDPAGNVWVATSGAGLFRLSAAGWERIGSEHGLPSDDLHGLGIDDRGDVWAATGGGLALIYEGDVLPITPTEGLSSPIALPVMQDRSGVLWVGSFGGGVTRIEGGDARVIGSADGLPHDVVLSLAEDPAGRTWVGTRAGLRIVDGQRVLPAPADRVADASVTALLAASDGRMWVGTTEGVHVMRGDSSGFYGPAQGLVNPWVTTLHQARDGSMLVGTQNGGAFRVRGSRATRISSSGGPEPNGVMSFHETEDGSLWIAAAEGLFRFRGTESVLLWKAEGVPDRSTARMLADSEGHLWIGTNRGVYRVAQAQLDSVADGLRPAISPRMFTERDGMPSSESNGGFHPAGWPGQDGRLYFPTMGGVAVFDPAAATEPSPLRVRVQGIGATGSDRAWGAGDELPAEVDDVALTYTALDFRHGDQAEFRYRLVGYDTAWVSAGARRTAYYTHLAPGSYTFSVQARLPGTEWETADPFAFRMRPFFYETWWFTLAAAVAALLAMLGLHRWRVHLLRKRQKELVQLVKARESAERRYRQIFENAREIVLTLDSEGRIEEANREALRALGRGLDDLVLVPFDSLATPVDPDPEPDLPLVERIAADDGLVELTLQRPDGTSVRVEASARELTEDGGPRGYQLIGRDVTDRHLLEDRLRQSQRMEAVGLLAGGVAHDFNNILSVISGYSTLLLQGLKDSDPLREDVTEISDAADRAAGLTHQLLAFSRRQTLRPRVLQLNEVIEAMERLLRRLIGEDIEFVVDLEPDLWNVTADPGQMEQVITNLAVNARDAMPEGGRLEIRTGNRTLSAPVSHDRVEFDAGDYVVLSVRDEGMGMDDSVRERIFEPFFSTKPVGRGTGLGLSTVHGIVEQSGGFLIVESSPGAGATFHIHLPREMESPAVDDGPQPEVNGGAVGHETILVVDDEASIRRLARRVLERNGYEVVDAASPLEVNDAMARATSGAIDLLLTDVVMPHMSGPDLAERMTTAVPTLKVVFMSGYTDEKAAQRVSGEVLLRKPFAPAELLSMVREALDG